MRGDLHALVHAAVEPHACAAGGSVGHDAPGVGPEVVGGVLGGHAALHGEAAHADAVLGQPQIVERGTGGDAQLRLDEVDVGDFFGHRVLHLDARVHLDEDVPTAGLHQELHRARVDVADGLREANRICQQLLPHRRIEVAGGRHLDHLLEAPLH